MVDMIMVTVPDSLFARLNDLDEKRHALAAELSAMPRAWRYSFLRGKGVPAAFAKSLRDSLRRSGLYLEANIDHNTGQSREVRVADGGIRVPVLDREAIIPVAWPETPTCVQNILFVKGEDAAWRVQIKYHYNEAIEEASAAA